MQKKQTTPVLVFLAILIIIGLVTACNKADAYSGRLIKAVNLTGIVQYERSQTIEDVYLHMNFEPQDGVTTAADSDMVMQLDADRFVYMFSDTKVTMETSGDDVDNVTTITLISGEIFNDINSALSENSKYEIKTSNAILGIHGTEFYVKYDGIRTIVYCKEGKVNVKAANNEIDIAANEGAIVEDDTATPAELTEIENDIDLTVMDLTVYQVATTANGAQPVVINTGAPGFNYYDLPERGQVEYNHGLHSENDAELVYTSEVREDNGFYTVTFTSANGEEDFQIVKEYMGNYLKGSKRYNNGVLAAISTYEYDEENDWKLLKYTSTDADGNLLYEIVPDSYKEDGSVKEATVTNYTSENGPTTYVIK